MKFFSALVSISLSALLAAGQTPGLNLQVIERNAAPDGIAVEVTDPAGNRVPDAKVVFRLPDSATFADGSTTAVAATDANGQAGVDGILWRTISGTASVRITASKGTAHAGLLFEKKLAPPVAPSPVSQPVPVSPARVVPANQPEAAVPLRVPQDIPRESPPPAPGVVVMNDDSPNANVPIRPLVAEAAGGDLSPRLSIVSSGKASSDHHVRNRILIGLAVAAGAGAAIAFTHGSGSSGSSTSGITIGPPSVSVGH